MPEFRYRAVAPSGGVIDGRMAAPDKAAVVASLQQSGHIPIRAQEIADAAAGGIASIRLFQPRGLRRAQLVLFTRQMATLLRAGLPLDRALQIITGLITEPPQRRRLEELLARIEGGKSLADAMAGQAGTFPAFYIGMIRAGEAGASLDAVLERLADFVEHAEESRQMVRSALLYPAIVGVTCLVSLGILFGFVIPQFRPLLDASRHAVPLVTRIVLDLSDAVQQWWWTAPPGLLALTTLVVWQARRPATRARWDRTVLRLPMLGDLVRKLETARFCRTLGTLLRNGVPILSSMGITRQAIGNLHLAGAVQGAIEHIKEGRDLSAPLARTGMFPPLAIHLLKVGDETGKPDEMLLKIADIYDQETRRTIARLLTLLAPAVTVVLGVIIAAVMGSIMTAVMSTYSLAN
ncbi:MAG: type II secretion system F family protein [Rhodospirillales bacterium]|nr:type II secretion system F family protein [Rhodospirillales bacterium]